MKPIELNSANFDEAIVGKGDVVLVDFHASWCGPCKQLSPIIDQIAEKQGDNAVIAKVDIDQAQDIAQRYQITSVPTLMAFRDGKPVAQARGVQNPAAIEKMIDQAKDAS